MKKLDTTYKNVSLSHATMREEDLIPCFVDFLKDKHPNFKDIGLNKIEYGTEDSYYFLNEDILNAMNEIAPEGCYFGSHPGDGSDYGFWENEENY